MPPVPNSSPLVKPGLKARRADSKAYDLYHDVKEEMLAVPGAGPQDGILSERTHTTYPDGRQCPAALLALWEVGGGPLWVIAHRSFIPLTLQQTLTEHLLCAGDRLGSGCQWVTHQTRAVGQADMKGWSESREMGGSPGRSPGVLGRTRQEGSTYS